MLRATEIEAALREALPAEYHSAIPSLAQVLADVSTGALRPEEAQARLGASADLADALRTLDGHRLEVGSAAISFNGAQTGDVTIDGDVAGGDAIKLTLNLTPTTINTEGGDYAEGGIDKRRGAFISGGSVQGPVVGVNQGTVNATYNYAALSSEERLERRNRTALLELVRRFWIEDVLHHSLHQQVYIELGMQTRPDVIEHPWQTLIRLPDSEPRPLDPSQPLLQVFKDAGKRLLILGAPGSGKTTTLLILGEALINEAVADEDRPIPVIFSLSTWAVKQPPLDQWLIEELAQRYKVPPKVGKAWVEHNEILPLLDGLDEVGPTNTERTKCVGAINAYLAGQGGQLVVCSRTAEYEHQRAQFQVETAVEIQPLTAPHIGGYLERLGSPLAGLRTAVAQDAVRGDLAASPLLLSVMALTYRDQPAEVLMGQARKEADQRLWTAYVRQRLQLPRADAPTDSKQLQAWLIWLARGMITHGQQVFYIEYLQPSWLAKKSLRLGFVSTSFLAVVFLSSLFGCLVGSLIGLTTPKYIVDIFSVYWMSEIDSQGLDKVFANQEVIKEAPYYLIRITALVSGVLGGLINGIFYSFDKPTTIQPIETLSWRWNSVAILLNRTWKRKHVIIFLITPILTYLLILRLLGNQVFQRWVTILLALLLVLMFAIPVFVFIVFSIMTTVKLFSDILVGGDLERSNRPNEGIIRSLYSALRSIALFAVTFGLAASLLIGMGCGVLYSLAEGLRNGLKFNVVSSFFGLSLGVAFGVSYGFLLYGGSAAIKHLILRIILHRHCHAPWNFAAFLDEAVSRGFMTRVGGGYRFYHRLLQEHFANHEETTLPVASILGPQKGDKTGGRRTE